MSDSGSECASERDCASDYENEKYKYYNEKLTWDELEDRRNELKIRQQKKMEEYENMPEEEKREIKKNLEVMRNIVMFGFNMSPYDVVKEITNHSDMTWFINDKYEKYMTSIPAFVNSLSDNDKIIFGMMFNNYVKTRL